MFGHDLDNAALAYHAAFPAGKVEVSISKPTDTQDDLALAYTPGVAAPVLAIEKDPESAYQYTIKGNLVGVITNGSAVLGLGNVGALASKPVMEGKAVLFKRFSNINVFDIEVNADNVELFIQTVVNISPTFGGINLEDIKAPECFEIEKALIDKLDIPVFHDDQHGTAIIIAAGLLNALELQGKKLAEVKIACLGAGAAGIASMRLLLALGVSQKNIVMLDRLGVIHSDRQDLNIYKQQFAVQTDRRTLADAVVGADVFIGVAGEGLFTPEMLNSMAAKPIIFALSNPNPEIQPELAHRTRSDLIMATGRSDYPNQINNVLCFPYIFRGALDVRAHCINQAMQIAAVHAIKDLAREETPVEVVQAYRGINQLVFGADYIIPKPMDPRLLKRVAPAVAKAAIATGVVKDRAQLR